MAYDQVNLPSRFRKVAIRPVKQSLPNFSGVRAEGLIDHVTGLIHL